MRALHAVKCLDFVRQALKMARDTEIMPPGPHGFQKFMSIERSSRIRTHSRSCTVCGKFYLVRYGPHIGLDPDQLRFVKKNITPCEAKNASRKRK